MACWYGCFGQRPKGDTHCRSCSATSMRCRSDRANNQVNSEHGIGAIVRCYSIRNTRSQTLFDGAE